MPALSRSAPDVVSGSIRRFKANRRLMAFPDDPDESLHFIEVEGGLEAGEVRFTFDLRYPHPGAVEALGDYLRDYWDRRVRNCQELANATCRDAEPAVVDAVLARLGRDGDLPSDRLLGALLRSLGFWPRWTPDRTAIYFDDPRGIAVGIRFLSAQSPGQPSCLGSDDTSKP